jgi:hypothetical protein
LFTALATWVVEMSKWSDLKTEERRGKWNIKEEALFPGLGYGQIQFHFQIYFFFFFGWKAKRRKLTFGTTAALLSTATFRIAAFSLMTLSIKAQLWHSALLFYCVPATSF